MALNFCRLFEEFCVCHESGFGRDFECSNVQLELGALDWIFSTFRGVFYDNNNALGEVNTPNQSSRMPKKEVAQRYERFGNVYSRCYGERLDVT